ncbi:hypothetical protein F5050DRAFT_1806232 [Lentinula boryana]|uniref:Uncharacterized protein n=1 Tax=Lentinula boryana TaxID=40481 RepID=A0ABQ8QI22_9AGAR|nr:hypothetical protein F5050DRAFT_1806232 [Lentinula boryana]
MSLKRGADSSPARSSKRRQILFPSVSNPVTPAKTPSSIYQFPSSPSTPYPLYPSDSPSNPFGRTRTLSASLPPKSSFGRHLPLRFQFFRHGMKRGREGVYRVVQVPLSYNFKHVKTLIAFLFGGQPEKSPDEEDEKTGHLFEIRENVVMYSNLYKLGTIKKSETSVRLSSARDPYRFKQEWDYGEDWRDDDDDEFDEREEDQLAEDSEDGKEEARWEAEEDYTLGHVWKPALGGEVPDAKTAIVYFHSSLSDTECPIQVQITLHKGTIPSRKGAGNSPYVFEARGHVYLSPLDHDELDPEEDYTEDLKMDIDPSAWNEPTNAFAKFLIESAGIPLPDFSQSKGLSENSTPSLVHDFSSPSRITDPFPSSPYLSSSSPVRAGYSKSSPLAFSASFPEYTPAPPPAQRKRVAYIQKRIERSKRKKLAKPDNGSDREEDSKPNAATAAEKPSGPRGIDGRYLTREEAMRIIGADDNVAEV